MGRARRALRRVIEIFKDDALGPLAVVVALAILFLIEMMLTVERKGGM